MYLPASVHLNNRTSSHFFYLLVSEENFTHTILPKTSELKESCHRLIRIEGIRNSAIGFAENCSLIFGEIQKRIY